MITKSTVITSEKVISLEKSCRKIQQEQSCIRFVGVINKVGHMVAGGFRDGVLPHVDRNEEHMMYMSLILEMKMRQEFDDTLGQVLYIHSQREKINMISIPAGNHVVLVATTTNDASKVVDCVKKEFLEFHIHDTSLKSDGDDL